MGGVSSLLFFFFSSPPPFRPDDSPFILSAFDGLNGAGGGGGGVGGTLQPPHPGTHFAFPEATLRHPEITPVPDFFISVKTLSVLHQQCLLVVDQSHTEQPSAGAPVQVASQASAVAIVPAKWSTPGLSWQSPVGKGRKKVWV